MSSGRASKRCAAAAARPAGVIWRKETRKTKIGRFQRVSVAGAAAEASFAREGAGSAAGPGWAHRGPASPEQIGRGPGPECGKPDFTAVTLPQWRLEAWARHRRGAEGRGPHAGLSDFGRIDRRAVSVAHSPGLATRGLRPLAGLTLTALLSGCASIGSQTLPRDRFDYSSALTESWKYQTLLNVVKLRYMDTPIFVDVAQIVSAYQLETLFNVTGRSVPTASSAISCGAAHPDATRTGRRSPTGRSPAISTSGGS